MNFTSPVPGFSLQEINLYPYITWAFYGAFLLFTPFLMRHEKNLFTMFLVSLVFESALLIDVGFFIRPSYIIGLILILKTAACRGIKFPARYVVLLALFVLTGVAGIFLNLDLVGAAQSGEARATFIRPIIQMGQLVTLILIVVSVFTLLRRERFFRHTVRVLHFVSVGIALYAIWEIVAIYFNLPYLNLDSMRQSYWYIGFGTPLLYIFRPHATFIEPIELNNFLFLGIASSFAYRMLYNKRGWKYWGLFLIQLVVLFGSFSRSTMITIALLTPFLSLFYPRRLKSVVGFVFDRAFRFFLVVVILIVSLYILILTPEGMRQKSPVEQVLFSRLVLNRTHKTLGFSSFGRADALGDIQSLADAGRLGFGVGIGNEANWWGGVGGTANLYNQIIIYTGVIGLGIFFIFLGSIFYGLFRNYWRSQNNLIFRQINLIFFIGFLGMIVQRLSFSGLLTDTYLWVAFALCIYLGQRESAIIVE